MSNVLVFFTSGNDKGHTKKSLEALIKLNRQLNVNVVVGRGNEDIQFIKDICKIQGWNFHCQVNYMAQLMAEADIAIGAGGSSTWERCYFGIPALVVVLAENQNGVTRTLHEDGVLFNLGWHSNVSVSDYLSALRTFKNEDLLAMSQKSLELVDGMGVERVASQMVKNISQKFS